MEALALFYQNFAVAESLVQLYQLFHGLCRSDLSQELHLAMAEGYSLNNCFECGCCSYVCPSHIPLVQYFRIAKAINREQAA